MKKIISFKGLRNLTLLAGTATILLAVSCKKKDVPPPTPIDAPSLVGTTWKENTNEKAEIAKFKITFITDSTFDCTKLKDEDGKLFTRTDTWSDGITRTDTIGWAKRRYTFDYKDGKGNVICKISNYRAMWGQLTENPFTAGYRRELNNIDGTIATFTINNNVLNFTYIDTTTGYTIHDKTANNGIYISSLNEKIGLHPAPAPVQIIKQ